MIVISYIFVSVVHEQARSVAFSKNGRSLKYVQGLYKVMRTRYSHITSKSKNGEKLYIPAERSKHLCAGNNATGYVFIHRRPGLLEDASRVEDNVVHALEKRRIQVRTRFII